MVTTIRLDLNSAEAQLALAKNLKFAFIEKSNKLNKTFIHFEIVEATTLPGKSKRKHQNACHVFKKWDTPTDDDDADADADMNKSPSKMKGAVMDAPQKRHVDRGYSFDTPRPSNTRHRQHPKPIKTVQSDKLSARRSELRNRRHSMYNTRTAEDLPKELPIRRQTRRHSVVEMSSDAKENAAAATATATERLSFLKHMDTRKTCLKRQSSFSKKREIQQARMKMLYSNALGSVSASDIKNDPTLSRFAAHERSKTVQNEMYNVDNPRFRFAAQGRSRSFHF